MLIVKTLFRWLVRGILALLAMIVMINTFIIVRSLPATRTVDAFKEQTTRETNLPVLVLGAGVINNEEPSSILQARLDKAYELYQQDPQRKFIMSGDHMEDNYNEVDVMKKYLMDKGIPSEQIYLDHAGYSTYESMYRLKNVLGIDQAIIVTQGYHLPRALMIARHIGLKAWGCPAAERSSTRLEREGREILARLKDFAVVYFAYPQDILEEGYAFDIEQSGDLTNDKDTLVCK